MKLAMRLYLILGLLGSQHSFGQSTYLLFRGRLMQPVIDLFDKSDVSIGLNAGYGKIFGDGHWSTEHTIFIDELDSRFDFAPNKYFAGTTFYGGLALTPGYCFNPENKDIRVTASVSLKAGYNWGVGIVYQTGQEGTQDKQLEYKTAKGGFTLALAPAFSVEVPVETGSYGLEAGYDTSNYGAGINPIKSAYYHPINYNTGYFFVGIFRRWY